MILKNQAQPAKSSEEDLESLSLAAKDLQQRGELQPPPDELLEAWHEDPNIKGSEKLKN